VRKALAFAACPCRLRTVPYHGRVSSTTATAPQRRPNGRRLAIAVAVVLVVWGVLVTAIALRARRDMYSGIDRLEQARDVLTPEALVRGDGVDLLLDAEADFRRAHNGVRSPLLAPLRVLPVVGRQVRAVDGMTSSAAEVVDAGVEAIEDAGDALERAHPRGEARVEVMRDLGEVAARAAERLDGVDPGPDNALVGPVHSARERFDTELTNLRDATDHMGDATTGLADFLKGPRSYLLLAANNAEMRVGSGTFLSVGVLKVADGTFELGDMRPTEEFEVAAGAVPIEGDLADRWGWLQPNREWRNLGASPRFDTQAALAAQMWRARTGQDVDGVLALDPMALSALLAATGPVEVGGLEITAGNVVPEILLEQYRGLVGYPADQPRRDRLNAIARAAVKNLESADWETVDLVDELRKAAGGRHILAWSARADEQRGWIGAGIAGAPGAESVLLGVHNRGGNKLDQFLDVRAGVSVAADAEGTEVRIRVEMSNGAPEGLPQYVAGPFPEAEGAAEGLYQGIVVAELPHLARDLYMTDTSGERLDLVTAGADGPSWVVATYVEVPRGQSRSVVVRFRLPPGSRALVVDSSARIPPVAWTFAGTEWRDRAGHRIEWGD